MYKLKYSSNNNVVYSNKHHVVWCPKYRRKVLGGAVGARLELLIQACAVKFNARIIALEVMPDHVHLLISVDPQFGIARFVKYMKGWTSYVLRREFPWLQWRLPTLWTNSYFTSTVGGTSLKTVKQYIESQ